MALRQPQQRPQVQVHRQAPVSAPAPAAEAAGQPVPRKRPLAESQEWILFSPAVDDQHSLTSYTSQTPRTANLSRLSDFGSLETGVQSERYGATREDDDENLTCQGTEIDDDEAEELDSLDDGLHAFHGPTSPRLDQSGGTVLPTHDGLGTFPTTYAYATTEGLQDQFWQFERHNPHRRRLQRRRSSVQKRFDAMAEEEELSGLDKHEERRLRIEKWRLEQSRAVLEEIEKETRRRRRRMSMLSGASNALSDLESPSEAISIAASTAVAQRNLAAPTASSEAGEEADIETETFWQRITRRVIKDLMGLDETTLSVIFGEELAPDATPTQASPLADASRLSSLATHPGQAWETRLLDRIARELGILVHQLSEHEGAFSTYVGRQPELGATTPPSAITQQVPLTAESLKARSHESTNPESSSDALFAPTFPKSNAPADTWLWGIEEEPSASKPVRSAGAPSTDRKKQEDAPNPRHDEEYWEQDLDIGMIFRYLRNRFSSRSSPSSPAAPPNSTIRPTDGALLPAGWAAPPAPSASALGTSPESQRRADLIRRHHPLVSNAASVSANRRRESLLLRRQHQLLAHRRATSSSCASQSTKRTRSGGSRKYWDFPSGNNGSTAGGSLVSVGSAGYEGMMGSWGEV
ncbi:hypothetical protein MBLNU459_g7922t1 [Dothideomycetes sp. NU459]